MYHVDNIITHFLIDFQNDWEKGEATKGRGQVEAVAVVNCLLNGRAPHRPSRRRKLKWDVGKGGPLLWGCVAGGAALTATHGIGQHTAWLGKMSTVRARALWKSVRQPQE